MAKKKNLDKLPGSIVYYDRDWLFPLRSADSDHYSAKIDADGLWRYAEFDIGSSDREVHLSFWYNTQLNYDMSLDALDRLNAAIVNLKAAIKKDRTAFVKQQKKKKAKRK